MSYEVKTPALIEAIDIARDVARQVKGGTMEAKDASILNNAAGKIVSAVSADVRARLAEPKIRAYEAKLIEGDKQRQIPNGA
jgi:hypothetical protein